MLIAAAAGNGSYAAPLRMMYIGDCRGPMPVGRDDRARPFQWDKNMSRWNNQVATTEQRKQEKRNILIREAGAAFGRKGFHSTTLDEVAKKIGITKAAIYYYFKDKNEILLECHKVAIGIASEAIKKAQKEGENGYEKLIFTIRNYIIGLTSELKYFSILVDVSALRPDERDYVVSFRDKFEKKMRGFVEEGIKDGSILPCEPKFAIFAMMGAVSWVPSWYSPNGERSGEEIADLLISFFSHGIQPVRAPDAPNSDAIDTKPVRP